MKLSIIIPTYNEKENIKILIPLLEKTLKKQKYNFEIIVVDDNSPDGTWKIAESLNKKYKNIRIILRKKMDGIGSALREGYNAAKNELIISMDADLSYEVGDILSLIEKIEEGYDLVVGTRHNIESYYEKNLLRTKIKWTFSNLGNKFIGFLTGIPIHDFTANFRIIKKSVWSRIKTKEKTNTLLLEMILRTYYKKHKVAEIPITFKDRRYGESKLKIGREAPKFFIKLLFYVIKLRVFKDFT